MGKERPPEPALEHERHVPPTLGFPTLLLAVAMGQETNRKAGKGLDQIETAGDFRDESCAKTRAALKSLGARLKIGTT
jgi:hypothetical protein